MAHILGLKEFVATKQFNIRIHPGIKYIDTAPEKGDFCCNGIVSQVVITLIILNINISIVNSNVYWGFHTSQDSLLSMS